MKGGLSLTAQQANRLYLAHLDIEEALNYLRALSELDDLPTGERSTLHGFITDAVFIATIVVYCRPFVDSAAEGMAMPKLGPSLFKGNLDVRLVHRQVLDMRQQAIAHSDWRYHGIMLPGPDSQFDGELWRSDFRHGLEVWKLFELFTVANDAIVTRLAGMNVDVNKTIKLTRAKHRHGPIPQTLLVLM